MKYDNPKYQEAYSKTSGILLIQKGITTFLPLFQSKNGIFCRFFKVKIVIFAAFSKQSAEYEFFPCAMFLYFGQNC